MHIRQKTRSELKECENTHPPKQCRTKKTGKTHLLKTKCEERKTRQEANTEDTIQEKAWLSIQEQQPQEQKLTRSRTHEEPQMI